MKPGKQLTLDAITLQLIQQVMLRNPVESFCKVQEKHVVIDVVIGIFSGEDDDYSCNCPITGVRLQPTVRLQLCRLIGKLNETYLYVS